MLRITGSEVPSLMEALSAVYAPQELTEEQIWEEVENWVNSLLEEGHDLSEYTWEEMYEQYITEIGVNFGGQAAVDKVRAKAAAERASTAKIDAARNQRFGSGGGSPSAGKDSSGNVKASGKVGPKIVGPKIVGPKIVGPKPSDSPAAPAAPAATRPAAPKVAPTKPASAQTGDKAKDMATWAKANPKLAAAAAERARTRGTSSTTNPLMQDMKSRLPAAAAKVAPTPAPARSGFGVSAAPIAAKASVANVTAPEVKATNTIAATPKLPSVSPRQQRLNMEMEYDAYDVVLEYLLSQGHVETVEEAHYVMMEMDAETIGTIVEAAEDQSDKQIEKGVKTTYKAGNVLDNQHQGRSRGLNRLPATERAAKEKRMRGRLKARRDDLFGERNKREDSAREEMKKKYGL